jgi:transposase
MEEEDQLRRKYELLLPRLNERDRRLVVAAEAMALGHGGITKVHKASGLSRVTIRHGIKDLENPSLPQGRIRRKGAGRKKKDEQDQTLVADLERLIDPVTRGDPQSPLRWTSKSLVKLKEALQQKGHVVSHTLISHLLRQLGYSLQSNRKRYEGEQHGDRDAQFAQINQVATEAIKKGNPVVSVDTKKKELVGNYKKSGQEWERKGKPQEVNTYDFPSEAMGKAIPYGVYDLAENEAIVNVGTSSDTAMFAVASIRTWWHRLGKRRYKESDEIVITADCGGSNSNRARLWKWELQQLANELQKAIRVCHFPPGTSKWNKIEHRLFCYISINWRGKPLVNYETIIALIGSTTTNTGLKVFANLDVRNYQKGIKITDEQMKQISIEEDAFHPEWNYIIRPRRRDNSVG